jgi:hypothetical protein
MFDLEQAIVEWRRQMLAAGINTPVPLEELESHLREDIETLRSSGMPEHQAFPFAVSRLGAPGPMQTEFNKVKRASLDFVAIGAFTWIGAAILLAWMLSGRVVSGRPGLLLLAAHIFSLTTGYFAAFLTGGFGIYYVCCRRLRALSPARRQSLKRAVFLFSRLSAGLVTAGLVLGMAWSEENRGRYLSGNPREIGALCAAGWLAALWMVQRSGQVSEHVLMVLCVGGSMVVSMAWFGAGALAHGLGIAGYWPLDVLLGVHLLFLVLGFAPVSEAAEA